jgi:hypothetical protein
LTVDITFGQWNKMENSFEALITYIEDKVGISENFFKQRLGQ